MPPRTSPTARQSRLGAELRKMRERAGMTGREAAHLLGVTPMQMSHLEVGRVGVSEERVRRLATQYRCADRALVDALSARTHRQPRAWWEDYRGVLVPAALDLAESEHHAVGLRTLQIVYVPGLLQTEPYMRAIHTYASPEPPPEYLDAIVDFRLRRRQVLDRQDAPPLDAVIHEAALRTKVGDGRNARKQLEFLLESADRPGITLRVVPFKVDGFAGSGYSMLYLQGPVPQLDTVQLDTAHGSLFLNAEAELDSYRALLDKVSEAALPPAESQDLIHSVARDI